jgi:hypothetical protein
MGKKKQTHIMSEGKKNTVMEGVHNIFHVNFISVSACNALSIMSSSSQLK